MTVYYHKHVPGLSMKSPNLHNLFSKGTNWQWSYKHSAEFKLLKEELENALVLQPFDPNAEVIIMTDVSPDCVGAILFNKIFRK